MLRTITLILPACFLSFCGNAVDDRFASPYDTFKTRQKALADRDLDLLWSCYSQSYKTGVYEGDEKSWKEEWHSREDREFQRELAREIADERIINARLGYLLFDASTVADPSVSPFLYFLREPEGWKMTTFLDSVFHAELEQAIEQGEFKLPRE